MSVLICYLNLFCNINTTAYPSLQAYYCLPIHLISWNPLGSSCVVVSISFNKNINQKKNLIVPVSVDTLSTPIQKCITWVNTLESLVLRIHGVTARPVAGFTAAHWLISPVHLKRHKGGKTREFRPPLELQSMCVQYGPNTGLDQNFL